MKRARQAWDLEQDANPGYQPEEAQGVQIDPEEAPNFNTYKRNRNAWDLQNGAGPADGYYPRYDAEPGPQQIANRRRMNPEYDQNEFHRLFDGLLTAYRGGYADLVAYVEAYQNRPVGVLRESTLHLAIRLGFHSLIRQVVLAGAQRDAKDIMGETPLFLAVRSGDKDIVQFLVANGAETDSINTNGHRPLDVATHTGQSAEIIALVRPFVLDRVAAQRIA